MGYLPSQTIASLDHKYSHQHVLLPRRLHVVVARPMRNSVRRILASSPDASLALKNYFAHVPLLDNERQKERCLANVISREFCNDEETL